MDVFNQHEPIRQEAAHARAKKKQKVTIFTGHVIVADAREPGEPQLFYFSLQDAPKHMQKQLKQNNNTTYEFLSNDGAESLMGLVNVNSQEAVLAAAHTQTASFLGVYKLFAESKLFGF